MKYKKYRFNKMAKTILTEMKSSDSIFQDTHLKINLFTYTAFRILLILTILAAGISGGASLAWPDMKTLFILAAALLFTSPQDKILNIKTPFYRLKVFLMKKYKEDIEHEIYNSISQLKNIIITQEDRPLSSIYILEMIIKFANKSKNIFAKTLSFLQEGNAEGATEYFKNSVDNKSVNDLANMIIKLDYLNPLELREQLTGMQTYIRQERMTQRLKEQELISNIIFIPVIANIIVILMNFIIITIWMDSLYNMLNIKI